MILFIIMIILSPVTAVLPAIYTGYLILEGKIVIQKNYWNVGLIILSIWASVSAIANKSPLSMLAAIGMLLYLAISVLAQNYLVSERRINTILTIVTYFTTVAAIIGVVEKFVFIVMGYPHHRIYSTFGNPNMTGAWFASIVLIIIYLKETMPKNKCNKSINICLSIIVVALLMTESTGAFIAFVGSLFVYYLAKKNKNNKHIFIVGLTVFIIAILFILFQRKVNNVSPVGEIVGSFNSRYDIWQGSLRMFGMKPILGWGLLGTLEHGVDFMVRNGNSIHSHNLWLTFLVSTGIVGLFIYLFMKIRLFLDLIKVYKLKNSMVALLVALNMMVIIQGLVDCSLYAPQLGILFMFTASIIINIARGNVMKSSKKSINKINDVKVKDIAG